MADTPTLPKVLKTYHGNCHCGAFRFSVKIPDITKVTECNCSICFKKGYKWIFPREGCFTVEKGEGALKEYEFGQKATVHKFCSTCGTAVLEERKDVPADMRFAVNARGLLDIDLWSLKVIPYDGTDREPKYIPAVFDGPDPTAIVANSKIYTGSCHCGGVTLCMKTKGWLADGNEYIQECDCSICARNGTTLIYPHPSQVSIVPSTFPTLTSYSFGPKTQKHKFCSTCGTSIYIERIPLALETFKKWHTSKYEGWLESQAVNLKLFEGVEWDAIEVKKAFWSQAEPKYVCPE